MPRRRNATAAKKKLQGEAANRDNGPVVAERWKQAVAVWQDRRILAIGLLGFASGLPLADARTALGRKASQHGDHLFAAISTRTLKFSGAARRSRRSRSWSHAGRRRSWLFLAARAHLDDRRSARLILGGSMVDGGLAGSSRSARRRRTSSSMRFASKLGRRQYAAGARRRVHYRVMLASGAGRSCSPSRVGRQ
jgi:hypothetical protein